MLNRPVWGWCFDQFGDVWYLSQVLGDHLLTPNLGMTSDQALNWGSTYHYTWFSDLVWKLGNKWLIFLWLITQNQIPPWSRCQSDPSGQPPSTGRRWGATRLLGKTMGKSRNNRLMLLKSCFFFPMTRLDYWRVTKMEEAMVRTVGSTNTDIHSTWSHKKMASNPQTMEGLSNKQASNIL